MQPVTLQIVAIEIAARHLQSQAAVVCAAGDGSIALYVRNLSGWNLQHEFREHTAKVRRDALPLHFRCASLRSGCLPFALTVPSLVRAHANACQLVAPIGTGLARQSRPYAHCHCTHRKALTVDRCHRWIACGCRSRALHATAAAGSSPARPTVRSARGGCVATPHGRARRSRAPSHPLQTGVAVAAAAECRL